MQILHVLHLSAFLQNIAICTCGGKDISKTIALIDLKFSGNIYN